MKIKQSLTYHLQSSKKSIIIYYIVMAGVFALSLCMSTISRFVFNTNATSSTDLTQITIFFLFVSGLNFFKENFRMSIQNAVSRRTFFISAVTAMAIIALGMAIVDNLILLLGNLINGVSAGTDTAFSFIQILILSSNPSISSMGMFSLNFIYGILSYLFAFVLGYLITLIYYRLPKLWKIIVSISIPVGVFVLLPIVDLFVFNLQITELFSKAFIFITSSTIITFVTIIAFTALFGALSYLLVRRAEIKEK